MLQVFLTCENLNSNRYQGLHKLILLILLPQTNAEYTKHLIKKYKSITKFGMGNTVILKKWYPLTLLESDSSTL
jgi:hypothetical protein